MSTREESDRVVLGERLRECREYVGYSQDDVASVVGLSRPAISLIETGQRKVEVGELKRLAEIYGQPVSYFTGEAVSAPSLPKSIHALARRASKLSENDLKELARFAEFLESRAQPKKGK